jgi:rubrerythrin
METRRFYREASNIVTSVGLRNLLSELADGEEDHQDTFVDLTRVQKISR